MYIASTCLEDKRPFFCMKRPQKVSNVSKKEVFCKRPQKRRVVETPGILADFNPIMHRRGTLSNHAISGCVEKSSEKKLIFIHLFIIIIPIKILVFTGKPGKPQFQTPPQKKKIYINKYKKYGRNHQYFSKGFSFLSFWGNYKYVF